MIPFPCRLVRLLGPLLACLASPVHGDDPEAWRPLLLDQAASVQQIHGTAAQNRSYSGNPLVVNGVTYPRGIGSHAPSEIVFALDGKHKQFAAQVGMDDNGGPTASAQFSVLLDGREAFASGPMRYHDAAKPVALDVTGVKELRLVTADIGDGPQGDHADWIDPAGG
ncbi:MAG: NPCBM/NEW2 domain-containing protein [Verrucomicrobiota bacterium]